MVIRPPLGGAGEATAVAAAPVAVGAPAAEAAHCWRLVARGQLAADWLDPCSDRLLSEC